MNRPQASELLGIDLSAEMIAVAEAKASRQAGRVRFQVAGVVGFEQERNFDLAVMLHMAPFSDSVVTLLRHGRFVLSAHLGRGSRASASRPCARAQRD
jgi:2-polyprenyl-3-methyl-5-hydroxy-6-metoxy-1,4-benzoquinol methylase